MIRVLDTIEVLGTISIRRVGYAEFRRTLAYTVIDRDQSLYRDRTSSAPPLACEAEEFE